LVGYMVTACANAKLTLQTRNTKEIIFFIFIVFKIQLNYLLARFDAPGS
jgi:hypothetical protein